VGTLIEGPSRADIFQLADVSSFKEAKRISHMREDLFIRDCLLDAWGVIDGPEGLCRRAVLPQTWAFTAKQFPTLRILRMPVPTATEIVSVKHYDSSNVQVTLDGADYGLQPLGDRIGVDLLFQTAFTYPDLYDRFDAIEVVYKAGWPDAASVPRVFRRALLLLAAHFYENREATFSDNRVSVVSRAIEWGVDKLLSRYVVPIDHAGRRS
jgi:uncharacterized phiE125 gp8 family phage protein